MQYQSVAVGKLVRKFVGTEPLCGPNFLVEMWQDIRRLNYSGPRRQCGFKSCLDGGIPMYSFSSTTAWTLATMQRDYLTLEQENRKILRERVSRES